MGAAIVKKTSRLSLSGRRWISMMMFYDRSLVKFFCYVISSQIERNRFRAFVLETPQTGTIIYSGRKILRLVNVKSSTQSLSVLITSTSRSRLPFKKRKCFNNWRNLKKLFWKCINPSFADNTRFSHFSLWWIRFISPVLHFVRYHQINRVRRYDGFIEGFMVIACSFSYDLASKMCECSREMGEGHRALAIRKKTKVQLADD